MLPPGRLIELSPAAFLYAMRGAAKAVEGDIPGSTADFDLALEMATDAEEVAAIEELREAFGL